MSLKSFFHHLADAIEADAPAVIRYLRDVGVKVPGAVGEGVAVGAGIVGNLTADGIQVLVPPLEPKTPGNE